jgi:two-component system, OmpR family, response regulator RstA
MVNYPLKQKILLVESNAEFVRQTKSYLQKNEFIIDTESREDRAISRAISENPDIVILDISCRDFDALNICEKIRSQFKHPILILTSIENDTEELKCLELGADDYLPKPSNQTILLARIRMLLRRSQRYDSGNHHIVLGQLSIDYGRRQVNNNCRDVNLSTAEFDLLVLLAKNAGEPLTRDQISLALRGYEWNGSDRSVDLTVSRLRKKLGDNGRQPQQIRSVRNIGYMLTPGE